MRLIDADALIDDIDKMWDMDSVDDITASTVLKQVKTDIKNMPTVDAVPVIRCENCRHFDGDRFCDLINQAGWHDNDFCSYAERRQE